MNVIARQSPALSTRQSAIAQAATMAAAQRARVLRAEGRSIISLTLGEPDFASPPHAIAAAHQAALRGDTKYPPVNGTPGLKAAIQRKFQRDSGLIFQPDQILVGHGARQIIFDALIAMLDQGDEVIIPAPYWNAYPLITQMAGATPIFVNCTQEQGFLPNPEAIARAITPRTKCLVLNFPNNPTGAVCPEAHLAEIAAIIGAHRHFWVMADDMYEHLIHDGTPHATLAAVAPNLAARTLTISGVSKTYAMTGWRVGFAAGPPALINAMGKIQGQSTGGVSPITQAAAQAALDGPQDHIATMRATYAARSARTAAALNAIGGITCHRPAGAFYLYPHIGGLLGRVTPGGRALRNDQDVSAALLEEAGVATVQGAAFGTSPHIRLSTATDDAALDEACQRIARFCAALSII